MMGNAPGREITATQSGIMIQQGNSGIDDKRNDISEAIADSTSYMLGLMMEFWPAAKAIRIAEDSEDTEWVDARQLRNIPAMIPTDNNFDKTWRTMHPGKPAPKYMQLESEMGTDADGVPIMQPQTKRATFDVQISIGEGMPTSKLALFNIILSLSKLALPDEMTGQMRPLLSYQQVQKLVEDIVGLPIMKVVTQAQNAALPMVQPGGTVASNQNVPNATAQTASQSIQNPYIDGAGLNGMSNQPMGVGQ
jgi:hypothetical protein